MSILSDNPLYQELLNKGYVPGTNPDTGVADIAFILNTTPNVHKMEISKQGASLTVLDGGENNNPSEAISMISGGTKYSATLTPLITPPSTDRVGFASTVPLLDVQYCYGIDLKIGSAPVGVRMAVYGYDQQYQYIEPNSYTLALAGLYLARDSIYLPDGSTVEATGIYNILDSSQSLAIKALSGGSDPDLQSLENMRLIRFGNTTFTKQTQAYTFDLETQTNPLTTSVRTMTSHMQDFRWNMFGDGDFDGWTFGLAFTLPNNPKIYAATVDITYIQLFIMRDVKIKDLLIQKIIADNPDDDYIKGLFSYEGAPSYLFDIYEDVPWDTSSNMGPSFDFNGQYEDLTLPDNQEDAVVILHPDYDFGSAHPVINIARDYFLGVEIAVEGTIEHVPYPIFSRQRIVNSVGVV